MGRTHVSHMHAGPRQTAGHINVTTREYSVYHLAIRYNENNSLVQYTKDTFFISTIYLRGCDLYICTEDNNLKSLRYNQSQLRTATYKELMDHLRLRDVAPNRDENVGCRKSFR